MKKDQGKENRSEEARAREEIILKKVIIPARGFAVARTTNKAEPVGRCARQKGLKRKVKRLWRARTRTENYCTNQQDHFCESVNIFWVNVRDYNSKISTVISLFLFGKTKFREKTFVKRTPVNPKT